MLAYHHTRPFWPVHIVVIPKRHIASLLAVEESDGPLLLELMGVIREVAKEVLAVHGACAPSAGVPAATRPCASR